MPFVSDDEQAEIEVSLGSPDDYNKDEFIDLTNWVRHGGSIVQYSSKQTVILCDTLVNN